MWLFDKKKIDKKIDKIIGNAAYFVKHLRNDILLKNFVQNVQNFAYNRINVFNNKFQRNSFGGKFLKVSRPIFRIFFFFIGDGGLRLIAPRTDFGLVGFYTFFVKNIFLFCQKTNQAKL